MKNRVLVVFVMLIGCASSVFAQEEKNAARNVEIAWVPGYMRVFGENQYAAGVDVAVRATDSIAVVGEFRGASSSLSSTLAAYRGGLRYSNRSGNRVTTFIQAVAGGASVLDGGSSGFSLATGGGIDVGLKNWLGLRVVQGSYEMFRFDGLTFNGFRINTGLVFRIGARNK